MLFPCKYLFCLSLFDKKWDKRWGCVSFASFQSWTNQSQNPLNAVCLNESRKQSQHDCIKETADTCCHIQSMMQVLHFGQTSHVSNEQMLSGTSEWWQRCRREACTAHPFIISDRGRDAQMFDISWCQIKGWLILSLHFLTQPRWMCNYT